MLSFKGIVPVVIITIIYKSMLKSIVSFKGTMWSWPLLAAINLHDSGQTDTPSRQDIKTCLEYIEICSVFLFKITREMSQKESRLKAQSYIDTHY